MAPTDKLTERLTLVIKAHQYNQVTWFCWCGQQMAMNEWAEHVAELAADTFRKYRRELPVATQKHEHHRLCYLNECQEPGDFPQPQFRIWTTEARAYQRYEIEPDVCGEDA